MPRRINSSIEGRRDVPSNSDPVKALKTRPHPLH
jgi:hypothetical protein